MMSSFQCKNKKMLSQHALGPQAVAAASPPAVGCGWLSDPQDDGRDSNSGGVVTAPWGMLDSLDLCNLLPEPGLELLRLGRKMMRPNSRSLDPCE